MHGIPVINRIILVWRWAVNGGNALERSTHTAMVYIGWNRRRTLPAGKAGADNAKTAKYAKKRTSLLRKTHKKVTINDGILGLCSLVFLINA